MSKSGWWFILVIVFAAALSLGSQGQNSEPMATAQPERRLATATPARLATATPRATAVLIGPYEYPDGTNPMTGLPYPNAEVRSRRNLIVKISNHPPIVRPQHGLNAADLIFEYEAEGNVTRFAAVYRTNSPGRVGSIRSGRLLDIELLTMYSALLAYSGTSGPIRNIYLNSNYRWRLISPSIGDNCESAGFCRDGSLRERGYEHTLFGDTDLMWQVATKREVNTGFRATGFAFSDSMDIGGIGARDVFIDWSSRTNARWQYDEASGRYLRYSDGMPHYDATDGMQVSADNLIVLEAEHRRRPDLFAAGASNESLEVALWDSGRAYVFRDGEMFVGFWKRLGRRDGEALQLMFGDSQPIPLRPGRSWISVARGLGMVEVNADLVAIPTPTPQES